MTNMVKSYMYLSVGEISVYEILLLRKNQLIIYYLENQHTVSFLQLSYKSMMWCTISLPIILINYFMCVLKEAWDSVGVVNSGIYC